MGPGVFVVRQGVIIGVVLAGGRSTRFGRDKAMLSWQGKPLIERQIEALRAAGVDAVRVSGDRPAYGGIPDAVPGKGPLAGLARIAAACPDDDLLVIPVDMPLLSPALLCRLRTEMPEAACLRFSGRVLPMRLRADARCRGMLEERAQAADAHARSLRALQAGMNAAEVSLSAVEAVQLTDCNTEAVWRELA